jgi:DNA-directed RNA polymerase specialized sigma24 family protein
MSIRIPWTDRHTEVAVKMAAEGITYRVIGERLGRPEHGVAAHLRRIRKAQEKAVHDKSD